MSPFGVKLGSTPETQILRLVSELHEIDRYHRVQYLQSWELCLDMFQSVLRPQNAQQLDVRNYSGST